MPRTADIGSKRLVSLQPTAWARWLTGQPTLEAQEILSGDFQWIGRTNDVLIKVVSPEVGTFLLVNEIQIRPDPRIGQRIRAYAALAEERYDLKTSSVVVNILPPSNPNEVITTNYHSEVLGQISQHEFKVINLWEQEVNLVFEQNLSSLLPFVPILKDGGNEGTIMRAVTLLRGEELLRELEPLLAFFASFVLNAEIIQRIMRWDMTILRESPWYKELVQEGFAQGIEQGKQEGKREGQKDFLLRFLTTRFEKLPASFIEDIDKLDSDQLLKLTDFAFTAPSLEAVEKLLLELISTQEKPDDTLNKGQS
jgi:predicted transposase YdaD